MSVILLSGGLDSMILLAHLCDQGAEPLCVTFQYGQRHLKEVDHAKQIAAHYGRPHRLVNIEGSLPSCPMTGAGCVPLDEDPLSNKQLATVVPNRNATMIAVAAAHATHSHDRRVYFACHAGDSPIYQDCRQEFVAAIDLAMRASCGVRVCAPFVKMTRRSVIGRGRELGVQFAMAWSCYTGLDSPCGRCGACLSRASAEAIA